ncbi:hypothetical protein J6590_015958 [Homalodisca vitripennis]|nr:hypothetical protein J6590_015958 [Homalodisca vitripennis]
MFGFDSWNLGSTFVCRDPIKVVDEDVQDNFLLHQKYSEYKRCIICFTHQLATQSNLDQVLYDATGQPLSDAGHIVCIVKQVSNFRHDYEWNSWTSARLPHQHTWTRHGRDMHADTVRPLGMSVSCFHVRAAYKLGELIDVPNLNKATLVLSGSHYF